MDVILTTSWNFLQNIEQVVILFDDRDELLLRDRPIRVEVKPVEQLLCLGLVGFGPDHLVHGEYCSERNRYQEDRDMKK